MHKKVIIKIDLFITYNLNIVVFYNLKINKYDIITRDVQYYNKGRTIF